MYALAAICITLGFLLILLRLKMKLGVSMILSSVLLAVLLGVSPKELFSTIADEWQNKALSQTTAYLFVTLTIMVNLINVLGVAMEQTGVSRVLGPALQGLFKSRRIALVSMPLMMGMLPTPGGIMLSAPMVRQLGDDVGVGRARLAAINYLFRHQWEPIWPLFPAVPFIQGMLGISAFKLISHHVFLTFWGILGGIVFLLLWGMPAKDKTKKVSNNFLRNLKDFLHALWPIALTAILYTVFNITPAIGIFFALLLFLVVQKVPFVRWGGVFKAGFEFDFILLILGALMFKVFIESADAVTSIVVFFTAINIPVQLLIFLLPFLVAILTGITIATVAISYPLLMPFIMSGQSVDVGLESLAFCGLLCGLYITPVHLCVTLSAGYFEVGLIKIILRLTGPVIFLAFGGILIAYLT